MKLTPDQIDLLRTSFRTINAELPPFAGVFYARLFDRSPEVRPMFRGDLGMQGVKLMNTLGTVIAQIHDLEPLKPILTDLARRHVRYGVVEKHYGLVGEALLWAMACALGDRFDADTQGAWAAAYEGLSSAMIAAAYPSRAEG